MKRLRDFGGAVAEEHDPGDQDPNEEESEEENEEDDDDDEEDPVKKNERKSTAIAPEFESSRIHNGQLEFMTLVRCVMDRVLLERLWPRLSEDHFASDTAVCLFKRLRTLNQLGKDWPRLAALAMDPALDSATQAQLRAVMARIALDGNMIRSIELGNGRVVSMDTTSDYEGHVFDLLDALRITRQGVEHFVATVETVANLEEFDPLSGPELVEKAASEVMAIRGQESISDSILHFGAGLTTDDDRKREGELKKLFMADRPRFRTGFDAFDSRAGGFQGGEVVLLGSGTAGGKTAAQMTMMSNMARMGTSVAMLQLELSLQQMDERLASHLARIDSNLIRSGNISDEHKDQISAAWKEFHDECGTAGGRFTIWAPSSQTITGCEMVFKQYPYKVWFIDYVNLLHLDGLDAKLQGWEKLSRITKAFKTLAKKYNICIVLGVQVNIDAEGNIEIRYAKAMKEDADIVLVWDLNQEAKDAGAVYWRHLKARQYEPFDFELGVSLQYYSFENLVQVTERKKKRTLGKQRVLVRDEIDKVVDNYGDFRKKDKPLIVPGLRPIMEAALAGDISALLQAEKTPLYIPDSYGEFDDA